ncbi:MAG: hypothetical protein ABI045_06450 [Flavobacteriales bacterium]
MTKIQLAVLGFRCVGTGLYHVLHEIEGIRAEIKKICIKYPEKPRPIKQASSPQSQNNCSTTHRSMIMSV